MRLAEPGWLVLLVLALLPFLRERTRPRLAWPTLGGFRQAPTTWVVRVRHLIPLARSAAIACMVLALARPQSVGGQTRVAGRGVAIVVAFDQSSSMEAPLSLIPGSPSRLESAKATFARFVESRPDDLIGLVSFANYPKLSCTPTLNHAVLLDAVAGLKKAGPADDGTNLGFAIARATDALVKLPPSRKVLVLLTDGRDNPAVPQPLDPRAMARLAGSLGVTLHAIAVGNPADSLRATESRTGLNLPGEDAGPDLDLLGDLATIGGGQLFQADGPGGLDEVFRRLDELEKSPIQGRIVTRYREEFAPWAAAAAGLLAFERLLAAGRWRRLP